MPRHHRLLAPSFAVCVVLSAAVAPAHPAQALVGASAEDPTQWAAAVRAALAQDVEPPPGSCRIVGRVVDPDGRGVPGADVWISRSSEPELWPETHLRRGSFPDPEPLAAALGRAARAWRRGRAQPGHATTDAEGRFELTGLAAGRVLLRASADGWEIPPARYWSESEVLREGAPLVATIEVEPLRRVPVDVRFPDGTEPARAWLVVRSSDRETAVAWTPNERTVELPAARPDRWVDVSAATEPLVRSYEASRDAARFRSRTVSLPSTDDAAPVVLELRERRGVFGTVVDPEARLRGLEGSFEIAEGAPADSVAGPSARGLADRLRRQGRLVTQDGRYALLDVPPGRYTLRLADLVDVAVDVGEGLERRDIEVPPGAYGREVHVTALDHTGAPVRAQYMLEAVGDGPHRSRRQPRSWPHPDGGEWVTVVDSAAASEPRAPVRLLVTASGCPGTVTLDVPPDARELVARFGPPARAVVRVEGRERLSLADDLEVSVRTVEDVESATYGPRLVTSLGPRWGLDADGRGRFQALAPGRHVLELARSREGQLQPLARRFVELRAGENELAIEVPALYVLVLSVPALAPGTTVVLEGADELTRSTRFRGEVDGDRVVRFPGLVAGTYRVRGPRVLEGQREGPVLVEVPAEGGMVTLDAR